MRVTPKGGCRRGKENSNEGGGQGVSFCREKKTPRTGGCSADGSTEGKHLSSLLREGERRRGKIKCQGREGINVA